MKRLIYDKAGYYVEYESIYKAYLEYCDDLSYNPVPKDTCIEFIRDYADLGYPADQILKELCKIRYEDTCYTCPFYEGSDSEGIPICCYVSSCKGTRDLVVVVPLKHLKQFLVDVARSPIKKVSIKSVMVHCKQYLKLYKQK